ncbi:hypothetical protein [Spirulina sp. 06S082]|uniref:hypothetical protein n=1 Tax=Spirulina sp. 06S082 TaxID=3110248 RepID=UPI002B1F9BD5|nr:hypothetical protein [Spirulina sp. 06S082]MEA5471616.1 hypothetical protein [Spirulina sp. 06S082]
MTTKLERVATLVFMVESLVVYGYVLAISLGFAGRMSGLLVADYYQGQGVAMFKKYRIWRSPRLCRRKLSDNSSIG